MANDTYRSTPAFMYRVQPKETIETVSLGKLRWKIGKENTNRAMLQCTCSEQYEMVKAQLEEACIPVINTNAREWIFTVAKADLERRYPSIFEGRIP